VAVLRNIPVAIHRLTIISTSYWLQLSESFEGIRCKSRIITSPDASWKKVELVARLSSSSSHIHKASEGKHKVTRNRISIFIR